LFFHQNSGNLVPRKLPESRNAIAKALRGLFHRQLIDQDRTDSFVLALSRACGVFEKRLQIGHRLGVISGG
jgi:hypothetical protein